MAVKSPNFGADRIPELAFFPHIFRLVGMGVAPSFEEEDIAFPTKK
jgi:hypothetical protein